MKLLAYIDENGHGSWRALPPKAGLQRCGKSCRLRWTNYLRPDIKRGKFSIQEEHTIIQLHALLGNRWSAIATHLPKRTDNEIKNYWNTHLKKRLAKIGIDPVTHKPKNDTLSNGDGETKSAANLSHMAQWESARLEAEARLVRESKFRSTSTPSTSSSPSFPAPANPWLELFRTWHGQGQGQGHRQGQGLGGVLPKTTVKNSQSHKGIDLESPTSTLSFSENNNIAEEMGEWKCLPRPIACKDVVSVGGYSLDPPPLVFMSSHGGGGAGINSSWLHDVKVAKQGGGSGSLVDGNFGDGLTEMLIEKYSDEQQANSSSEGVCCDHNSVTNHNYDNEEENKSYWNSLINLMNSSTNPSVSSPTLF